MSETRSSVPSTAAKDARDSPAGFDGVVRKAFDDQKSLLRRAEHCSLDPHRLQAIGRVIGSQIRVGRPSEPDAIYTVSETRPESTATTLRMGRDGRERLDPDGPADAFEVRVEARVPHPEYSDAEARQHSEFVERLDDECHQGRLVILAPHGGSIEPGTDQQAERVLAALGNDIAGAWRCKGFATEGAFRRFHITSSDLHESSFPLLATIASRNFLHAVAFHGFTAQGILIGGGAPPFIKEKLAQALEGVLAGEIPVRIANDSDDFDGDNPRNIVNRLTAGGKGGVQIEQSRLARDKYWKEIADAVAGVYHRIC